MLMISQFNRVSPISFRSFWERPLSCVERDDKRFGIANKVVGIEIQNPDFIPRYFLVFLTNP